MGVVSGYGKIWEYVFPHFSLFFPFSLSPSFSCFFTLFPSFSCFFTLFPSFSCFFTLSLQFPASFPFAFPFFATFPSSLLYPASLPFSFHFPASLPFSLPFPATFPFLLLFPAYFPSSLPSPLSTLYVYIHPWVLFTNLVLHPVPRCRRWRWRPCRSGSSSTRPHAGTLTYSSSRRSPRKGRRSQIYLYFSLNSFLYIILLHVKSLRRSFSQLPQKRKNKNIFNFLQFSFFGG